MVGATERTERLKATAAGLADAAASRAGARICSAHINGIHMEWADTGPGGGGSCPAVLFLHGWPESWFSFRDQLAAVKAAGYRGIAPSMRGYGATEAPEAPEQFGCHALAADMLALLNHLGVDRAALVGHDHGANFGWKLALLHPESFPVYMAMSVPYGGRPKAPPLTALRAKFGDERSSGALFNYQLHHCLPCAAAQYGGANTRPALLALLGDPSPKGGGGAAAAPPPVTASELHVDGVAEPLWRRLPQPAAPPSWLPPADFEVFVRSFEGGLNWYRVMDLDWHATPQLAGARVTQPVAFVAGERDMVIRWFGGPEGCRRQLAAVCEQPPEVHILPGAGHWVQQERAAEVSRLLLAFLAKHRARIAPRREDARTSSKL